MRHPLKDQPLYQVQLSLWQVLVLVFHKDQLVDEGGVAMDQSSEFPAD